MGRPRTSTHRLSPSRSTAATLRRAARRHASAGRWADAERGFLEVARLTGHASAFHDLGVARRALGDVPGAAHAHWNAAVRAPEQTDFALAFGEAFRQLRFEVCDPSLEEMAVYCLCHPGLNPAPYGKIAASLLHAHGTVGPLLRSEGPLDGRALVELAPVSVLLATLENAVVSDPAFERLVGRIRSALLGAALAGGVGAAVLELAVATALQSELTGFVLPVDEAEAAGLAELRRSVAAEAAPTRAGQAEVEAVVRLAVLLAFDAASGVAALPPAEADPDEVPAGLRVLWSRFVVEPALRLALSEAVPRHSGPEGPVSASVAGQYEQDPYPRWVRVDCPSPRPLRAILRSDLATPSGPPAELPERPRVLVAGCGTGKQALDAAFRYQGARVLALDFSRASLGYAAAGALRYGADQVEFLQADITALGSWDARFDVVEAGGVLHHLEDPMGAWSILAGLLAPAGVMRVALYSRLARRHITEARDALARAGFSSEAASIRDARIWMADNLPAATFQAVAQWRDFYSVEECRDLLFHPVEHTFTPSEIGAALDRLGLELLGFEALPAAVEADFVAARGTEALLDLDVWTEFEARRPDTFPGMYHFWVGRRRSGETAASV